MVFSYEDYYFNCLVLPLVMIVFFIVLFLPATVASLKEIISMGITLDRVFMFLLCLFILLFFIKLNGGRVLNGGVYLFHENARESITLEGTVEEISPYDEYAFPNISSYHHAYGSETCSYINGCKIVVDNTLLKAPDIGTINLGDYVSVTFLPKSRYILSISKTEH